MRIVVSCVFAVSTLFAAAAFGAGHRSMSDKDKTFYAIGVALSHSLSQFNLSKSELDLVKAGLTDGALHGRKPKVNVNDYRKKIQDLHRVRLEATRDHQKKMGAAYVSKMAKHKGAMKTASGLVYIPVKAGTGASPKATDTVKVNYEGALIDGTVFDSSVRRGRPATFPLNGVIHCWTEGLQHMKVGGKAKLVCPPDLAYGDQGHPPQIPPGATLVFNVELLDIASKK